MECFLNHPPLEMMENPITMLNIQQHQFEDDILNVQQQSPVVGWQYPIKEIQGRPVICYRADEHKPDNNWRIAVPNTLVQPIIKWYHLVLGHCGSMRLYKTID